MNNINVEKMEDLITPLELKSRFIMNQKNIDFVNETRNEVIDILKKKNKKKLVILGPCSIHEYDLAIEYANFIKNIQPFVPNLLLVMRVYFEKPRTTHGWKGYLYDPYLNNTNNIQVGLETIRKLLIEINNMKVPIATELLDTIIPQYIDDCISWGCIGARTTESQLHRQLVSGLSIPMGFKNGTSGNTDISVNGCISSKAKHSFLGINKNGKANIVHTKGNPFCNVVLRGSKEKGNNINESTINEVNSKLLENNLLTGVIIDLSHDNTIINGKKNYTRQVENIYNVIELLKKKVDINGVMIESNINSGSQPVTDNLAYGVSITDGCIDIKTTQQILMDFDNFLNNLFLKNLILT